MAKADETHGWSTLPLGTVLREKYRVDRVLGVGGTAVVYAVTHRNRRRFALKMLHADLSLRPDVRARFAREGYVANSVEHPSIVEVLDDDVDERGSAYLVMELLDGLSVEAFTTPPFSTLPAREALELADQLLDALEHAHRKSVVHRDIKPSNLFLTRDGRLKVLDFGVARLRERASSFATHTGATLGTPAFMAPEQARAEGGTIDARADVWAVGATLFALLSGAHVYEGENARAVLARCASEAPRSLAEVLPDAPAELVQLLDRALRVDPDERFPSAAAMRDAVREVTRVLHGERSYGALRDLVAARLARAPEAVPRHDPSPTELFFASEPNAAPAEPRRRWIAAAVAAVALLGLGALGLRKLAFDARSPRPMESPAATRPPAAPTHRSTPAPEATVAEPKLAVRAPVTPVAPVDTPRPRQSKRPIVASSNGPAPSAPALSRENPLHLEIQ